MVATPAYIALNVVVVAVIAVAWRAMPARNARAEEARRAKAQREAALQAEQDGQARAERERQEAEQRVVDEALEAARERKRQADGQVAQALARFKDVHDTMVEQVRLYAKEGCDDAFRQRFGVARPPKAQNLDDDREVQEYLREHYPELRDRALDDYVNRVVLDEAAKLEAAGEGAADEAPSDEAIAQARENLDVQSVRAYLQAAVGTRFTAEGKPIGEAPWPAYTTPSDLGYGELVLADGAPVAAQDAYRNFAWKKFHLGRRPEKPQRGEYSWPASHELGDADAGTGIETPAGLVTAHTARGPLPLREIARCAWAHRGLPQGDLLIEPDGRRFLLVNLEGMHKGERIELRFNRADGFLQKVNGPATSLCAMGQVEGSFVGIAVTDPRATSPGDAPCQLVGADGRGFAFVMTADARTPDADTYPQFLEITLAWSKPPSPEPELAVLHAIS